MLINMQKLFYLKSAISIIEECITNKMSVEQIANECFISSRQFYRDFYSLTGHTVNEYIRKRRLSRALNLLRFSKMSVADIAYTCGYSSQAALCKVIKYYLNLTATEYKNSTFHYFFPVYNFNAFRQIEVKSKTIPKTIAIHFYDNKLRGLENRAIECWQAIAPNYQGSIFGRNEKQCGNQFCYELMVEYSDANMVLIQSSRFKISSVKPSFRCTFANTIVKNNEQEIIAAWDYLYWYWMKNSMFRQDNFPYFEEYILKKGRIYQLVLCLPVIPCINYHKINITSCEDRLYMVSTKKGINPEKSAAETITEFISKQYPYLLETQKEYYVSKNGDVCTCGIRINENRYIPDDGSISMLAISRGVYAVMDGACFEDTSEYDTTLLQWIAENGYEAEEKPFTIYDISNGIKQSEIITKLYVRIKWQKNIRQPVAGNI